MSFNVRLDQDPVIICPYDKNHKIARSRIQRHLVKCEKNFPPDYKVQCPYDATHRFFEHELQTHVETCPRRFNIDLNNAVLPDIDTETESKTDCDESWDPVNRVGTDDTFNESNFDTVPVKHYVNVSSIRGNSIIAKRFGSTLRRPFGYSESMMMEDTNIDDDTDDDVQSICDDMGIGRGRELLCSSQKQPVRGVGTVYRRGIRGRLFR